MAADCCVDRRWAALLVCCSSTLYSLNATEHPGADGAPVHLTLDDDAATVSAAAAKVHGTFDVSGELRVFVNDDLSMYPPNLDQRFIITVRFSNPLASPPWHVDRTLETSAMAPAYQYVGTGAFTVSGVSMSPLDHVLMRLVDARWSLSPNQGREAWPVVEAEVSYDRPVRPPIRTHHSC